MTTVLARARPALEVLSISALDLFATSLGVFVLMAVILFPYYLKQPALEVGRAGAEAELADARAALDAAHRTATQAAEARAAAEARRAHAAETLAEAKIAEKEAEDAMLEAASRAHEAGKRRAAAEEKLAALPITDLDLVFVMDATGSMRDEIADIQANLLGIVHTLHRLAPTLNVGFVAFKDRTDAYVTRAFPLTPMEGVNLARLQAFVEGLNAKGGGDPPEPVGQALAEAIAMPWCEGVQGRIVIIGDAAERPGNWGAALDRAAEFAASGSGTAGRRRRFRRSSRPYDRKRDAVDPSAATSGGHPMSGDTNLERGWTLEGRGPDGQVLRLAFGETQVRRADPGLTMGRHPALAELVVDDPTVSRRHTRLSISGNMLHVEDLNSLNGTAIDGGVVPPFERLPLRDGQTLLLGDATLTLVRQR